jgi:hypothetical protein
MTVRGVLVAIAACLLASPAVAAAADEARPIITFLGTEALAVKAKTGEDTAKTYASVLNASDKPASISVKLEALSSGTVRLASFTPKTAVANGATRIAVTLKGLHGLTTEAVTGQLVVTGGVAPVARAVSITPPLRPKWDWPSVIFRSAVAVFVTLLMIGVLAGRRKLLKPAPGPKWSFSSWATTLTAAGGILGTVLGAATFPEVPRLIDKDTLVRLNLLFGVLVVVGPFVYQALRNPSVRATDQEAGYTGWNVTLLIACAVVGAATFGELATLGILGWELTGGGAWGETVKWGVIVLEVLAAFYFFTTVVELVTTDWKEEAKKAKDAARERTFSIVLTDAMASPPREQRYELELTEEEAEMEEAGAGVHLPRAERRQARRTRARAAPSAIAPSWRLP